MALIPQMKKKNSVSVLLSSLASPLIHLETEEMTTMWVCECRRFTLSWTYPRTAFIIWPAFNLILTMEKLFGALDPWISMPVQPLYPMILRRYLYFLYLPQGYLSKVFLGPYGGTVFDL